MPDATVESTVALRAARATNHLRATLMAGFTTIRDLGTEGAGYADVELKQAVEQEIIPGPRMLVRTRAIVATGSYAPKGFVPEWTVPQGAEEAEGPERSGIVEHVGHGQALELDDERRDRELQQCVDRDRNVRRFVRRVRVAGGLVEEPVTSHLEDAARACIADDAARTLFISGTASIVGHASAHAGDQCEQTT